MTHEHDYVMDACQEASCKLSDYVLSKPPALRPVVMAVIYFCILANLDTMAAAERELFDMVVQRLKVVVIPKDLDPRNN